MSPSALARRLERHRAVTLLVAVLSVFAVGWVDRVTGDRLSFSLLYLGPVLVTAWVAGARFGAALACLAAIVGLLADQLATDPDSLVNIWNALVRLGVLHVLAHVIARLRRGIETERALANTDPLTGVMNARAFDSLAERELQRSLRYGRPLTLAFIDLDHFKQVNDTLGHSIGDRLLRAVAAEIVCCVRPSDTVARLGGDEFAVLLPETDRAHAVAAFDRVKSRVLERMQLYGWPVHLSVGFSQPTGPGTTVDVLIADADREMYEQKRAAAARRTPAPASPTPAYASTAGEAGLTQRASAAAAG